MKTFQGSMVALATPLRQGAFDEDAFRHLIEYQITHGTTGLIPIGTTGEAVTLTASERTRVVKVALEATRGRVPVVVGAGSHSTRETVEAVAEARGLGADGALVVTPYYNRPTQRGLFEHYQAIARAHPGFPLIAYNVPSRTGVDLLPATCARLCELEEVVALKDATGNLARAIELLERCGDRLTLLSGDDATVLPFLACGGKGVISVSANVAPRKMADLVEAVLAGNLVKARTLQVELNPLHRLLFVETNPIPVKAALELMGMFGPELRLPLTPLPDAERQQLKEELGRLGLLGAKR